MKLIAGRPLRDLIEEATTIDSRLALLPSVLAVADAIAYAHSQGIVHRDLKPANIIVGEFAETIVIDWGLAKDLRANVDEPEANPDRPYRLADDPAETVAGAILGTPAYMAPEQARGERVDERADVYALGAVLYHVLSGQAPFAGDCREVLLAAVRTRSPRPLDELAPQLSPDLAAIVSKAMQWGRADRYDTAAGLASDLRALLTGNLVTAHAYTPRELLSRWISRHRTGLVATACALGGITVFAALSVARILHERDAAEASRRAALEARQRAEDRNARLVLSKALSAADADPTETLTWIRSLPVPRLHTDAADIAALAVGRGVSERLGAGHQRLVMFAGFSPDGRNVASSANDGTLRICDLQSTSCTSASKHLANQRQFVFAGAGSQLAFAEADGSVWRYDIPTRTRHRLGDHRPSVRALAHCPVRGRLITAGMDGTVRMWSLQDGDSELLARSPQPVEQVAVTADCNRIAVCDRAGLLSLIKTQTREKSALGECEPYGLTQPVFSPSGTLLAWPSETGAAIVVDTISHTRRELKLHAQRGWDVSFSPTGRKLASSGYDGTVAVVDTASWRLERSISMPSRATGARFSADEQLLAAADEAGHVRVIDLASGAQATYFAGGRGTGTKVDFSPDGQLLVSSDSSHSIRLWPVPKWLPTILRGHRDGAHHISYSQDGSLLLSDSLDKTLRIWAYDGTSRPLTGHTDVVYGSSFLRNGMVASASWDGTVRFWDLHRNRARMRTEHSAALWAFAASPDRRLVATGGEDRDIRIWSERGEPLYCLRGHTATIHDLAFVDSRRLLSASEDGSVRLWSVDEHTPPSVLASHQNGAWTVAAASDGTLASGGGDGLVRLYAQDGATTTVLTQHRGRVTKVLLSPDSRTVVSIGTDDALMICDRHGTCETQRAFRTGFRTAAFSNDGRYLAAGTNDGTLVVRRLDTNRVAFLAAHTHWVLALSFSPDGKELATAGMDGEIKRWRLDDLEPLFVPRASKDLYSWLRRTRTARSFAVPE
jgi:WD40 repeat protein